MANQTITQLPNAGPITGVELVPIVQDGVTVKTTTSALAGSPVMTQTFLTKNQEPTLNNSRYLATTLGLGLTDGGPNSSYTISLNATSGSLETASTGVIVKNTGATVVSRSLAASGAGLGVTNGDGVLGNPTFALTGIAQAVANLGGTGLMAIVGGTTVAGRQIYGTANQINVLFGNGSDDPRLSLAPDVVLPGTGAMTVPIGTTAQEPPGVAGQFRFNSDTQTFDGFANGSWNSFLLSGGVTSFSAGLTGLTPSVPTGGAVVLAGTLNVASGGTGVNTLTGYVKGAGTTPLTASATIPTTDLSGTISNAQLANSAVTVNGTTISLGGSGVITATASNPLTIGTGLSGTSYNGSTPVTIAIDNTVATLTGTQTLTNKTISGLTNTLSDIPNSALTNSSVTIGTTGIALGASSLTLGGLTSVTVTQDPSAALDLATKQYVDAVAEGLHVHASCACATTGTLASITGGTVTYNNGAAGVGATLTLSVALTTLDGYTLQNGNRILVKNEATQANNGIYTWATGGTVLTRATDFDTATEIASGDFTFISNGTLYANTGWVQTQPVAIVGTDPVSWQQFSGAGTYTAGTGLTLAGNQFSITNTGVSASTYGSASSVPVFAVNAQGQITSVTNTAIAINGSAVSGNISGQAGSVANALTAGTYLTSGGTYDGSVARTFAVDATPANIINKVVARDVDGNFSANIITADLNGNANTSTTATTATNLAGGSAGTIPYQSSAGITAQLAAGTSGQYLQSNGAAAPSWATLPAIGNGTLTMNVSGTGLSGSQTFTANQAGNATFTVTSNATSANTASTIVARDSSGNFSAGTITASLSGNATSATSATSATTATNLAGGSAGTIPYQSAAGTTVQLAAGTSGQVLRSNGAAAPSWVNGTISGVALGNNLNTLTMNTSGTGLSGSTTYNGSGAATFTVTSNATSANTASTIVARDASGNFSAGTITATLNGNATNVTGTVAVANGGTGQTAYTDGQLLIGNTATTGLNKATLTAGSGVTITNGNGSITISATGSGGTVTSVGATSPVASSGGNTPTISLNAAYGDTLNPYGSKTANFFLAAPNGTAGVPTFRAIVAADIPTLNQNTTGSAASVSGGTANVTTLTTSSTVTLNGGTANGIAYLDGSKVLTTGTALTYDGSTMVVNANTSADALRITQTGAGNALVVEDSANPDATPFVIDASGNVFKGYTASISTPFPLGFQINGTAGDSGMSLTRWVASGASPSIYLAKSRGASVATRGIVSNGDNLGDITFTGDDGTNFVPAAQIVANVDGTPGTNDMPGNLRFNTTADGASTLTERMRIDSFGRVGIGVTPSGGSLGDRLQIGLTTSSTTSTTSLYNRFDISATSGSGTYIGATNFVVTNAAFAGTGIIVGTNSSVTNQTANTVSDVRLYSGNYATTGGGTLTNLYNFIAGAATLTSGTVTNHFGFYSGIASGTGRWNFYAQGSADNYFAGNILRGRTVASTLQASIAPALQTHGTNSVSASSIGMIAWGTTQAPILQFARSNSGVLGTQTVVASGDTLGTVDFGGSDGTGFIRAATIAAQVDGTPGTNDMPGRLVFSTTADGASAATERARITSTGAWSFGSTGTNTGTSGQVLTSQGSGAAPTWTTVGGGGSVTVTNDTTTATDIYPLLATATSGTITAVNTSNANLLYTPSTGELKAEQMNAMNGIFVNAQTITVNYTVAATNNAMSAGPVTVASGISVTVSSGAVWTVV